MSGFYTNLPDAGTTGTPFAQNIRDNFWAVWQSFCAMGFAPGYDYSHNNSPVATPTVHNLQEQTANAAAQGRGIGARLFFRITLTYTSGLVTKIKFEYSANSGSTYAALPLDPIGNSFFNLDYTGRTVPFGTWATS